MKKLENLTKYQLGGEMAEIKGGVQVSGSFGINGSKFSYDGELALTADKTTTVDLAVFGQTGQEYVKDFCGTASLDGVTKTDCAQYINGAWKIIG